MWEPLVYHPSMPGVGYICTRQPERSRRIRAWERPRPRGETRREHQITVDGTWYGIAPKKATGHVVRDPDGVDREAAYPGWD